MFDEDDIMFRKAPTYYSGTSTYSGGGGFMFGFPLRLDLLTGGEATLDRAGRFLLC